MRGYVAWVALWQDYRTAILLAAMLRHAIAPDDVVALRLELGLDGLKQLVGVLGARPVRLGCFGEGDLLEAPVQDHRYRYRVCARNQPTTSACGAATAPVGLVLRAWAVNYLPSHCGLRSHAECRSGCRA
jgi:hypothetical protein